MKPSWNVGQSFTNTYTRPQHFQLQHGVSGTVLDSPRSESLMDFAKSAGILCCG